MVLCEGDSWCCDVYVAAAISTQDNNVGLLQLKKEIIIN